MRKQTRRPAAADQRQAFVFASQIVNSLYLLISKCQAISCGWAARFVTYPVGNPEDMTRLILFTVTKVEPKTVGTGGTTITIYGRCKNNFYTEPVRRTHKIKRIRICVVFLDYLLFQIIAFLFCCCFTFFFFFFFFFINV